MSKTIWKYEFPVSDRWLLDMPVGAKILPTVATVIPSVVTLWAEVDVPSALELRAGAQPVMEKRLLCVVGTGNPMPDNLGAYIGTTLDRGLVWHVYEGVRSE